MNINTNRNKMRRINIEDPLNQGYKRGDIILVRLEEGEQIEGSEQGGTRTALVIQNDTGNKYSTTLIVCFFTSKVSRKRNYRKLPTHVFVNDTYNTGLYRDKQSIIMTEQIRTISKTRVIAKYGRLGLDDEKEVNKALAISLAI